MTSKPTVCAFVFTDKPVSANLRATQHLSAIVEHMDMIMELAGIESYQRDIHDSHVTLILNMALSDMMRARNTISDALAVERDFDANRDRVTSCPCGGQTNAL